MKKLLAVLLALTLMLSVTPAFGIAVSASVPTITITAETGGSLTGLTGTPIPNNIASLSDPQETSWIVNYTSNSPTICIETISGCSMTVVAVPDNRYQFVGFYNGQTPIDSTFSPSGGTSYNLTAKFEISITQLTVSGTIVNDKTYDGTTAAEATIGTVSGIVAGDNVFVSIDSVSFDTAAAGDDKDVSVSYSIRGNDMAYYLAPESETLKASIRPAQITVSGTTVDGKTYDGDATATATIGTVSGIIAGDTVFVSICSVFFEDAIVGEDKDVSVFYSISGGKAGCYLPPESDTLPASIRPAPLTVSDTAVADKTYDGTTAAEATIGTVSGIIAGDDVSVSVDSASFDTASVGEDKDVTVTYSLSGEKADCYLTPESETLNASIAPKTDGITVVAIPDQTYTGNPIIPEVTVMDGEVALIDGTDYFLSFENNLSTGTATVSVTGIDNYDGAAASANFTILPKEITVTADAASKTYGDADPTFTATVEGLCGDDTADMISYTLSRAAGEDAGYYDITPAGDAVQGNYAVTYVPAKLNVKKAKGLELTVGATDFVYDGSGHSVEVTANMDGVRFMYSSDGIIWTNFPSALVDVGSAFIDIRGEHKNYEDVYFSCTLKVTPKDFTDLTVKLDEYDSTATGHPICPPVIVKDGDTVLSDTSYTVEYRNNVEVGMATVIVTGKGNYSGSVVLNFDIIPKAGDVDDDGELTMKDVLLIRQCIAHLEVTLDEANADFNGDGEVNMKDVLQIRLAIANGTQGNDRFYGPAE